MLWAITSYFNPVRYRSRLANYRRFRAALNVPLVAVEAAADGRFELRPGDADVLVQRSGGAVLWQKERLLTIALEHLPPECTDVAWLDCDLIFADEGWAERTSDALRRHPLVQPYSERFDESVDGTDWPPAESFGHAVQAGTAEPDDVSDTRGRIVGRPTMGLAWAARRSLLTSVGFYDVCVLGGADRVMAAAALGMPERGVRANGMNEHQQAHYMEWARAFHGEVRGNIGCAEGGVTHCWHGDLRSRGYVNRQRALATFAFDPVADIAIGPSDLWEWATDKPQLHEYVRSYFASRLEDGSTLAPGAAI